MLLVNCVSMLLMGILLLVATENLGSRMVAGPAPEAVLRNRFLELSDNWGYASALATAVKNGVGTSHVQSREGLSCFSQIIFKKTG
jgi:hypothetical protein